MISENRNRGRRFRFIFYVILFVKKITTKTRLIDDMSGRNDSYYGTSVIIFMVNESV